MDYWRFTTVPTPVSNRPSVSIKDQPSLVQITCFIYPLFCLIKYLDHWSIQKNSRFFIHIYTGLWKETGILILGKWSDSNPCSSDIDSWKLMDSLWETWLVDPSMLVLVLELRWLHIGFTVGETFCYREMLM